jgi:hypothetical protein
VYSCLFINYNMQFVGISNNLPANVNVLTLEQWEGSDILLRLEHIFQHAEDAKLSQTVLVDLNVCVLIKRIFSYSFLL